MGLSLGIPTITSRGAASLLRHAALAGALVLPVLEPSAQQDAGGPEPPAPEEARALTAALAQTRQALVDYRDRQGTDAPTAEAAAERIRAARALIESAAPALARMRDELATARDELALARQELAAVDADRQRAEEQLQRDLAAARATIDELSRTAAELEPLRRRLAEAEQENADLRLVATSSVEEVRALSEQLLAALAEKAKLVEASVELSSSRLLGDLERATGADGPASPPAGTARAALQDGAGEASRPPAGQPDGGAAYSIGLALVSDAADVGREWQRLTRLHPRLAALQLQPARTITIPGKGTFYRVLAGPFRTIAAAQSACRELQGDGADCVALAP